jgi:hypothetical protein
VLKRYLLPVAVALMALPIYLDRADAAPLAAPNLATVAPASAVQPVYYRGGGRVAVGPRGGVAVRGPRGGVAVRGGAYRVGGRYYGGVWYGTGRRFYGGRWWAYGVGSCWTPSPIGYVWTCG